MSFSDISNQYPQEQNLSLTKLLGLDTRVWRSRLLSVFKQLAVLITSTTCKNGSRCYLPTQPRQCPSLVREQTLLFLLVWSILDNVISGLFSWCDVLSRCFADDKRVGKH